jgi:hypothetical protein
VTILSKGSGANFKKGRRADPGALGERESLACQIGPKFKLCTRSAGWIFLAVLVGDRCAFLSECMDEFDELLQFFKNDKDKFGYFRINLIPGQRCFDLIWRFPIRDHSHGAFGQNEPRQLEESPEVGLRWDWRDAGHFFKKEGPLLTCAYVVLNWNQEFNLDEEDLSACGRSVILGYM